MEKIAVYNYQCPNCGGPIDNIRLELKSPCEKDLDLPVDEIKRKYEELDDFSYTEFIKNYLYKAGKLKNYKDIYETKKSIKEFEKFFTSILSSKPWSAQRVWFIRILNGESFSITAPTGFGKTTFGLIMALYLAKQKKKTYIILPTTLLVEQAYEKLQKFKEKIDYDVKVLAYFGKHKKEVKKILEEGEDFDILITSNQFLARNFELVSKYKFDFVFVDDVDALLKASKNIDRTLKLIGFTDEDLELAWKIIKFKLGLAKILRSKEQNKIEEALEILRKMKEKLERLKNSKDIGVLVLSSATGKARGIRVKLYRELLNFEIGTSRVSIRNIIDLYKYPKKEMMEEVYELCEKLRDGILIFVPTDLGKEYAEKLTEYLKSKGLNVELVVSGKTTPIKDFAEGKINILVGVAHYYGTMVRGLDLPTRSKYAIFVGVPRFKFSAKVEETEPGKILMLFRTIIEFLDPSDKEEAEKILRRIYDMLSRTSPMVLSILRQAIEEGKELQGFLKDLLDLLLKAKEITRKALSDEKVLKRIEEYPFLSLKKEGEEYYIYIPDVRTYIQASGRTSRMYAGGVTKGVSIILVDDEKLLRGLIQGMKWRFD